ncbi:terminase large subunit domain-containing protein [Planctomycetes bacterium Pan216]
MIPTDDGPRPFREVAEDRQVRDFAALDGALLRAAGFTSDSGLSRAWLERPRGGSKTMDIAVMSLWLVGLSRRRVKGIVGATDKDQGRLLIEAIDALLDANPYLREIVEVQRSRILHLHTSSEMAVISSDSWSSYGPTPDIIIAEEFAHWASAAGEKFWHSLFSSSAKRSHATLIVITNAGFVSSWQHSLREKIMVDPAWYFSSWDSPAGWMSPEAIDEQRRFLPPSVFGRLFENRWVTDRGDGLPEYAIDAAFDYGVTSADKPLPGYDFVLGVDLSVSRDATAIAVVGKQRATGRLRLFQLKMWQPNKRWKVPLDEVQAAIIRAYDIFSPMVVAFDAKEAALMTQQISKARPSMSILTVHYDAKTYNRLTQSFIEAFLDQRIELYPHEILESELRITSIVEQRGGFGHAGTWLRLDFPRNANGHCDCASALSLAILAAQDAKPKVAPRPPVVFHRTDSGRSITPKQRRHLINRFLK